MKLSDAILLGSTMHKLDPACWDGCLLGVSVRAVGATSNFFNDEAQRRWPWMVGKKVAMPDFSRYPHISLEFTQVISWLDVEVNDGKVTLEQVVDWVRSVEPEESKPAEVECEALLTRHAEDEGTLCGKQCSAGKFLCDEHYIE
jgi:hypothetical protein